MGAAQNCVVVVEVGNTEAVAAEGEGAAGGTAEPHKAVVHADPVGDA